MAQTKSNKVIDIPHVTKVEPIKYTSSESKDTTQDDTITPQPVLHLIYLMYKTNALSNRRVKDLLQEFTKPVPTEGFLKYLLEVAKTSV